MPGSSLPGAGAARRAGNSPALPHFLPLFSFGKGPSVPPNSRKGPFLPLPEPFFLPSPLSPVSLLFIFPAACSCAGVCDSGNIRITPMPEVSFSADVRLDFTLIKADRERCFILDAGFRENLFAFIIVVLLVVVVSVSFSPFLTVYEASRDTNKLNKTWFCSFPRSSSILTSAKKRKILMTMTLSSLGS